ncbi:MAG: hypothetical protein V3U60_16505 [Gammaproteobacteria bacterium]
MTTDFKQLPVRDRNYLDHLRTEPCIITGARASETDAVDPAHIGTRGKSLKSSDDEALPILHSVHNLGHNSGEITAITQAALSTHYGRTFLRACYHAYAREMYRDWTAE